ncbi:MAG: phosphoglucosamine mutase [Bacteroidia bacterium]
MTLITSISGIRGTIGGRRDEGLSPNAIVEFTAAYATFLKMEDKTPKVIVGRDARVSGDMVNRIVSGTLMAMGINVVDLGLSTTPTVELSVASEKAGGGIIITASHNPAQWNALKLLNEQGEFISGQEGEKVLKIAKEHLYKFEKNDKLGSYSTDDTYLDKHIDKILALELVDKAVVKKAGFSVVIDCVNSSGSLVLPKLLQELGVETIHELHCTPDGRFPHNPEPLPENLSSLSNEVKFHKADLGISVDPDVDRLALVSEDGSFFGEEYTLVAVADYVLKNTPGSTVSNLSSTRALKDITEKHGSRHFASAVGEVNVVKMMKEQNAVIGGEGNGGIIFPELHYGRDALVGVALFLTYLAKTGTKCSQLRNSYPDYFISKNKVQLVEGADTQGILKQMQEKYQHLPTNELDGVKIDFDNDWVHLRRSNTEPIIRIYAESESQNTAENLAKKMIEDIRALLQENNS